MTNNEERFEGILAAREKRYRRRLDLIRTFGTPLVAVSVNAPGPDKLAEPWGKVLAVGREEVERKIVENGLRIAYREIGQSLAGHWADLLVASEAVSLKRLTIAIENDHGLGRLLDLDVLGERAEPLGRESLGSPKRVCLVCGEPVASCRRAEKHSQDEVMSKMLEIVKAYFG
jgi:holo-ACP synthase